MFTIETSTHIAAPPDRVFGIITDLEGAAERMRGIKSLEVLTEGAFGVGTRFRETREIFGKEATEEMEVTEVTPGEGYRVRAESHGCVYDSVLHIRPEGAGCVLTVGFGAEPTGFVGRLASRLMLPLMRKQTCKLLDQDLADIKAAAEGGG